MSEKEKNNCFIALVVNMFRFINGVLTQPIHELYIIKY